jgi:bacteriophage N4 adsorption protein B
VHPHGFISAWPFALGILATVLLFSGLDDLAPTLICAWRRLIRIGGPPPAPDLKSERRIAIFVPCWKESAVIGNMIRHNVASICYRNYDFFLGVYPNDVATLDVAYQLAAAFRRVHVAACPHPGPTSKADCLNWIFHDMVAYERENEVHFDTVVLHDAEDLIHEQALSVINRERAQYHMVQIPVLPLQTRFGELTHGVYCDDFAEFQIVDMPARQSCRSFIPSNGVGTGFAREILDRLADERNNAVFNPASLTEDYEVGVYIHTSGYRQLFVPLAKSQNEFCATREYFPHRVKSAIRQRTRWVIGICLQSWERDGWRGSWLVKYWFWRDRKGLLANPLSLLTNVLFLAGLSDWLTAAFEHRPWAFGVSNVWLLRLCLSNSCILALRLGLRTCYTSRIYGLRLGLGVPLRALYGNFINCAASLGALWQYAQARYHRHPLVWLKTEHAYPGRDAVIPKEQNLAGILVHDSYVSPLALEELQAELRSENFLGEMLLARGLISDDDLRSALSAQSGVPFTRVDARRVNRKVARTLPLHIERRFGIVPFGLDAGRLCVAGSRVPSARMYEEVKRCTQLPVEFHLVTRRNYEELSALL